MSAPEITARRGACLDLLRECQMTPSELADAAGQPLATVYNDLRALAGLGLARMVGWTETSARPRRRARVWGCA